MRSLDGCIVLRYTLFDPAHRKFDSALFPFVCSRNFGCHAVFADAVIRDLLRKIMFGVFENKTIG